MTPANVSTIIGIENIDHAIATLVLAYSTDPVARWMYPAPDQYLLHLPRLFRILAASSFEAAAAHRTNDGLGVAIWVPPDIHGDSGPVEAVIDESIATDLKADVSAVFDQTEQYRPVAPHWYLSLIGVEMLYRSRGLGGALLEHGLRQCDRDHLPTYLWSSNPRNVPLYQRHGFEVMGRIQVGSSPVVSPMLRHPR
jgi:ribosomal protein S18 acetylase RimI-like enzyme